MFFVWVSVFNLFAVSVFWSFMADLFTREQGKRLFGFIGAGGTAGALLGPVITIGLSVPLGPVNLLIVADVLLEVAVFCVYRLERAADGARPGAAAEPAKIGGGAFAALPEAAALALSARHRRLGQPAVVRRDHPLFRAGQIVVGLGARRRRADAHLRQHRSRGRPADAWRRRSSPPASCSSASAPASRRARCRRSTSWASRRWRWRRALAVVVAFQVVQRWVNFAIANPARQVFFTVVGARGEVQGEEPDRRRGLSRLRRAVRLGVRQPAGAGTEARRDRAMRAAGGGRLARAVGGAGTHAGTPRRALAPAAAQGD